MSAAPERPCLLLVDDEPVNVQVLVALLKTDYDLKVATRGAQALKICEQLPRLDLILLDIMMPEMDGYEVCRTLRAQPATRDVPIIFLTALAEAGDVVRGFELGANDYVVKPFRPAELLARVRTQLTIRAQQMEIARKNTELKEILQLVAHDVANQFAVVNMSLELMAAFPDRDPQDYLPRIRQAGRNGTALTTLVREMRRLEDKVLTLHAVSLDTCVREAIDLTALRFEAKQLQHTVDIPDVRVLGDAVALTNSVFGNILSNAAKFSPTGATIAINARVEGDRVCVSVRDRGVGMPAEILATLFDVGRSHSRPGTEGEKGTGFGMPLMKKFVTQFGGKVEVVSRDQAASATDHGTEFHVWLRLAEA